MQRNQQTVMAELNECPPYSSESDIDFSLVVVDDNPVRDDVLADLIRRRFFPQMSYEDFAKAFLVDSKGLDDFVTAKL
jgi:hypothetical protein